MDLDVSVQMLANQVKCPIVLYDTGLNVVTFSVHDHEVDRARLSIILSHKGSERARAAISEHRVAQSEGAVLIPAIHDATSRVVMALRYDSRLTGYISYIPGDGGLDAASQAALEQARDKLGADLAEMELGKREIGDRHNRLLTLLLEGEPQQREAVAAELSSSELGGSKGGSVVLTVVPEKKSSSDTANMRLMVDELVNGLVRAGRYGAIGTVIDGEGTLILPAEPSSSLVAWLSSSHAFRDLRAGLGAPRASLTEARESRREARISLRATTLDPKRYGRCAAWSDLGVDRLLFQLPLEQLKLEDLPEPVGRLLSASPGPDLAGTLEAYLDNGADAQKTAASLHVHRSTLYYRLDRIRAVVDVDLADGEVRRELHIGLRVASLAGLR